MLGIDFGRVLDDIFPLLFNHVHREQQENQGEHQAEDYYCIIVNDRNVPNDIQRAK